MKLKVINPKGEVVKPVRMKDADKDEELSASDIKKLKSLIPHMDELLQLLNLEESEHNADVAGHELEQTLGQDDEEIDEEVDGEEVDVETKDEMVEDDMPCDEGDCEDEEFELERFAHGVHDSKKSLGSIERRRVVADSADDEIGRDNDVAKAWAKRYQA